MGLVEIDEFVKSVGTYDSGGGDHYDRVVAQNSDFSALVDPNQSKKKEQKMSVSAMKSEIAALQRDISAAGFRFTPAHEDSLETETRLHRYRDKAKFVANQLQREVGDAVFRKTCECVCTRWAHLGTGGRWPDKRRHGHLQYS